MTHLITQRLMLRRLAPQDIQAILTMESDPEVMRHTTGLIEATPTRIDELLAAVGAARTDGLGHWSVVLDETTIGWISLTPREDTGRVQLAYRFIRAAWGNGYATEAGLAIVEYSQTVLRLPECVAVVWPANGASIHVLDKLQFRREGRARHYGRAVDIYSRSY